MAKTKMAKTTVEERKKEIIKQRLEEVQVSVDDIFYRLSQVFGELTSYINRSNVSSVLRTELERLEDIEPEQVGTRVVLDVDMEVLLPDEQEALDSGY